MTIQGNQQTIAVIDYGMGNLHSVAKALESVAPEQTVVITSDLKIIADAARVVFPGQGAMQDCMAELEKRGLRDAVIKAAATKPFLGICVGLQMLFESSEEGPADGLAVFSGKVRRFSLQISNSDERRKIPHMGWNRVYHDKHPLFAGIDDGAQFYFAHSYYVEPEHSQLIIGKTNYGFSFTSAVARDNIFAVQYHPEKSAAAGLKMLSNFVYWHP